MLTLKLATKGNPKGFSIEDQNGEMIRRLTRKQAIDHVGHERVVKLESTLRQTHSDNARLYFVPRF